MGRSIGSIRTDGIPSPIMPTENIGMMSGAIRKKRGGRRDERGSRRAGIFGGSSVAQVTMRDPKTGRMYGGMVKDGVPQFKKPDFVSDEDFNKSFPKLDSRVVDKIPGLTPLGKPTVSPPMEKPIDRRPPDVGPFPDPTLGGPPEREVPIPKERPIRIEDGQKNFFETMFERAENKKQMRDIERGERRDRQESRREESRMRDSERGGGRKMRDDDRGGRRKKEDRGLSFARILWHLS